MLGVGMPRLLAFLCAFLLLLPTGLEAKTKSDTTFTFPKDKPINIVLFRPDIEVATLGTSGVPSPNPDWTADARKHFMTAMNGNPNAKINQVKLFEEQTGENADILNEYQSLFRAVGGSIMLHSYMLKLPTKKVVGQKKRKFDWTLGPGASKLGEIGGGNYGLFTYSYDAYATAGRKVFQFFMAMAIGYLPPGGQHFSYAALVDLDSGNVVWFNFYGSKKGDIRTAEGAAERVTTLLSTLPLREGEAPVKKGSK